MCLAQGHNTLTLMRLEPSAPQSSPLPLSNSFLLSLYLYRNMDVINITSIRKVTERFLNDAEIKKEILKIAPFFRAQLSQRVCRWVSTTSARLLIKIPFIEKRAKSDTLFIFFERNMTLG